MVCAFVSGWTDPMGPIGSGQPVRATRSARISRVPRCRQPSIWSQILATGRFHQGRQAHASAVLRMAPSQQACARPPSYGRRGDVSSRGRGKDRCGRSANGPSPAAAGEFDEVLTLTTHQLVVCQREAIYVVVSHLAPKSLQRAATCKKECKYSALFELDTLRWSPAMCATRQKTKQKQPPDRRAMCALLSCRLNRSYFVILVFHRRSSSRVR